MGRRKRSFSEMNDEVSSAAAMALREDGDVHIHCAMKKMRLCDPSTEKDSMTTAMECTERISADSNANGAVQLIPSTIHSAELAQNSEDSLIAKLCRCDRPFEGMRLNEWNGALVKYQEPEETWQGLMEKEEER